MKRKLLITVAAIAFIGALIYLVPCLVVASKNRPLHGNFDMGLHCMGGHEIFLYLEEDLAYENCPGHREWELIGPIVRENESMAIIHAKDSQPWLRIDYDGTRHWVTSVEKGWTKDLPQVANPWRTWLPKLLPES